MRESGVFTGPGGRSRGPGGSRSAHLFKQPQLSRGNENFHLCRAAQIRRSKSPPLPRRLSRYLVFPQLGPRGPGAGATAPPPICTSRPPHRPGIQSPSLIQVEN